jgi:hypothetical protein
MPSRNVEDLGVGAPVARAFARLAFSIDKQPRNISTILQMANLHQIPRPMEFTASAQRAQIEDADTHAA